MNIEMYFRQNVLQCKTFCCFQCHYIFDIQLSHVNSELQIHVSLPQNITTMPTNAISQSPVAVMYAQMSSLTGCQWCMSKVVNIHL